MTIELRKERTKIGEDERGIKNVVMSVTSNKFICHAFPEKYQGC